jgi:SOS-response transcriptional repressor LexA
MLKVVKNNKGMIKMSEMNLGDVAVITDELSVHLGKIVMAMGDEKEGFKFVVLDGTGNFFSSTCDSIVRVLQPGDMLEVV